VRSGEANLRRWRRITLRRQLPRPGFLTGVGAPSGLMMVCLILIGGAAAAYFARPAPARVPAAVRTSQADLVGEVAHRITVGAQRDADAVSGLAERYNADPTHNVGTLVNAAAAPDAGWRSVLIWDPASGAVLAAAGEPVAANILADAVKARNAVGYLGPDQRGRLLHAVKLHDGRYLGAAAAMGMRHLTLEPANGQTVLFTLNAGTLIYSQGSALAPDDPVRQLVSRAALARGTHTSFGQDVMRSGHTRVPLATAAPVDGTPYKVVSVIYAARTGASASSTAAILGLALIVIALAGFLWTRLALVRPLRRLLTDAEHAACGEVGGHTRSSRLTEVAQIGAILEKLRLGDAATAPRARRIRLRAGTVAALTSLAVVAWAAGMIMVVRDASTIPRQIVADYQDHADDAANALGDVLDTGLARLTTLAADDTAHNGGNGPGSRALSGFLRDNSRFRAVYRLDAAGHVARRAGQDPMRQGGWAGTAAGLTVDPHHGAVPVVLAHVPDGAGQLVAEFDVDALRGVLSRIRGNVRVLDKGMHSILATGGYIAFGTVKDNGARSAAQGAFAGAAAPTQPVVQRVVTASAVGDGPTPAAGPTAAGPAKALGWAVVITRDAADLQLPGTHKVRLAWLLALLAITVAVLTWVWQQVVFIRPLRELARAAEQVARHEHPTPVTPERFDEIGALAICLEVCRQAQQHGDERLAGAARLRGSVEDLTVVIPTNQV
jgi:HAMP domain-containing protein